ncbi:MAG TPA: hypothetical protein VGB02_11295 [Pyrinomonadaceae bacterium]|jgi:hypothetical protein
MKRLAVLLQKILPPVWCGMVLAIAVEAPLKFKAPGITRELGLGIGKLVFSALNTAELAMAAVLAAAIFAFSSAKIARFVFGVIAVILLVQTFWLIPVLMNRADIIISGETLPDSSIHIFYIIFEAAKVILLLTLTVLLQWGDWSKTEGI